MARERQQRARERKAEKGTHTVRIELSDAQYKQYVAYMAEQNGALSTFPARALMTGAAFVRNSGKPKGQKAKGVK